MFKTSLLLSILLVSAHGTGDSRLYHGLRGDAEQDGRNLKKKKEDKSRKGGGHFPHYDPPYTAGPSTSGGAGNKAPQNYNSFCTFFPAYCHTDPGSNRAEPEQGVTAITVRGTDGQDHTVYLLPNTNQKGQNNPDPCESTSDPPSSQTQDDTEVEDVVPPCSVETWAPGVGCQYNYACIDSSDCEYPGICALQGHPTCMFPKDVEMFNLMVQPEGLNTCIPEQLPPEQRVDPDDVVPPPCVPSHGTTTNTGLRCNTSEDCCDADALCCELTTGMIVGNVCWNPFVEVHPQKMKGWVCH